MGYTKLEGATRAVAGNVTLVGDASAVQLVPYRLGRNKVTFSNVSGQVIRIGTVNNSNQPTSSSLPDATHGFQMQDKSYWYTHSECAIWAFVSTTNSEISWVEEFNP